VADVRVPSVRLLGARASRIFDGVVALVLLLGGIAEIWVPLISRDGNGSPVATTVAVVVATVPLILRRDRSLAVVIVLTVIFPVLYTLFSLYVLFYGQFLPLVVATYSVARWGRGRQPLVGAAFVAAALVFIDLAVPPLQGSNQIVFHWGVSILAWLAGFGLRRYARRWEAALRRAVDAEVAVAEQAMAAVLAERTRIARELHDIVAHSASMIVVQAGAAALIVEDDPPAVRTALATIRSTGTDALGEMRRLVTLLRESDEPHTLAPQPGLAGLSTLIEDARSHGLEAGLAVAGKPRDLPAGVDLAAYRIVQEALTNVRRHATASHVQVQLSYHPECVGIEITDDGVGAGASASTRGGGHGLIGMRERAALYGGQLETGTAHGCGFTVRATLPLALP